MNKAILGKKLGMTQVFSEDGTVIPVTVIEAGPCYVSQVKTEEKDGYSAVQVAFLDTKEKSVNKPVLGHLKKAGLTPKRFLKEFKLSNASDYKAGDEIKCDIFQTGDFVDVSGITRGRGFSGTIKRWNARRLKMSHGTGPVHREVGSMGAHTDPGRVFKNRNMPGHYGHEKVTIQNLEVVKVDAEKNILLVKGSVPGPKGGLVAVRQAVKSAR
ncbi:MAG TPA: 50S ribosomal protein L3 [Clostridia bacterium]|jgi:large subunit ribosomal protein L3